MTDVAAQAAAYKDNIENQYRSQNAALNQQQIAGYQQQAANTAAAAGQAVNAGLNLTGMDLMMSGSTKSPTLAAVAAKNTQTIQKSQS